jgi:hypothetical protein
MIRRRRDRATQDETTDEQPTADPGPADASPEAGAADGPADDPAEPSGPYDVTEHDGTGPGYVDLGPLRIRGRVGFQLQVPQDEGGGAGSVVLVTEEAGLELRVFAAPRSGGLWDEVRGELTAEVARLEGQVEEVEGPFGPELRVQVPVTMPDGQPGVQPSRILAVEGPRWMLRATFLGRAALEPDEQGLLERALREVVVVRGDEPRLVREALLVQVPESAVPVTLPDSQQSAT